MLDSDRLYYKRDEMQFSGKLSVVKIPNFRYELVLEVQI